MAYATVPSSCSSSSCSATGSLSRLFARLDGNRIIASAGAIALNVAMLMLLLVPLAAPQWLPQVAPEPEISWIPRDPPKPVEPIPVPVVKARVVPSRASTMVPPRVEPQPLPQVEPQAGDVALPPADPVELVNPGGGPVGSIATPLTGAQLQYASAPPPVYPREALRAGQSGTVLLQVLVATDGKPLQVEVARSSGHRTLDRAAQRQVLTRWTFRPALQDGRPVQAIGLVPVAFAMQ